LILARRFEVNINNICLLGAASAAIRNVVAGMGEVGR
jgi:hypothetical protein